MYWAERDGVGSVPPEPEILPASCLSMYVAPLPDPTAGIWDHPLPQYAKPTRR